MEFKCLIDWKMPVAIGVSTALVVLAAKLKSIDCPQVLSNVLNGTKRALIGKSDKE